VLFHLQHGPAKNGQKYLQASLLTLGTI
jgi:hypothetical protein